MMMATSSSVEHHPGRQLEPPSSSQKFSQGFFSPLSYSRSFSSVTPSSHHHQTNRTGSNSHHPTPVAPPPPSIQKSVLVEGMANISMDYNGEISRLLSLSPGGGTPRSILSNQSSTTHQMRQDLQEVLEYIDGMTFVTPFKKSNGSTASMGSPLPSMQKTDLKPPRPSSVLADRSNNNNNMTQSRALLGSVTKQSSPWTTTKLPTTTTARDPTPSKPKPVMLDLLRENPNVGLSSSFFQSMMIPSTPSPVDESSLVVELSQFTAPEEEHDENNIDDTIRLMHDPPMDDSKLVEEWSSPPRRRVALDPEPTTHTPKGADTSILLGTAFADCDLMPSNNPTFRPTPIRTTWATPVAEEEESSASPSYQDGSQDDEGYHPEEELYFAASSSRGEEKAYDLGTLDLPATPGLALVDEGKLEELQSRLPQSPRDAKEWLQTAVLALQDARAERDAARQWAREMKEAVHKWAEEQRKLIRCETSTRIDALEEREHQVRTQTQALGDLQHLVQQLHHEFQSTHSERQASESQIQKLILDQQDRIHVLSQQLSSMEQTVTEGMSQANRLTPSSSNTTPNTHNHAFPQFVDQPAVAAATTASSQKSTRSSSSRVRKPLPSGNGHLIVYSNGVEKEVHNDGTTVVRYTNGDVETNFGTTLAYFHAAEQVLQITNSQDGSVLMEYPNGQIERHYANGVKAILFPDGTKAKISANGKVETYHRE
jgi:hypothetical protein